MSVSNHSFLAAIALAFLGLAGCGGEAATVKDGDETTPAVAAAEAAGVKVVPAAGLPKLDDPLPPLDGGRIEVSPPAGWVRLERDNNFLTRFVIDKTSGNPPRMLLTVQDASGDFASGVTADNVEAFAAAIAAEMEGKKLVEEVKPIVIGQHAFARYVGAAKKGNRSVDRQILITEFDGRRYQIALEVWAGEKELKKHRDHAYAVAAGLKFTKPGTATETPAPAPMEEAPASAPVDEVKPE
ncbi:MAG TPA: hypothetical protein VL096_05395 [Pirellulaceae bacterium]|nr:hypothetical protein [Pirellulaceae bacterium]